MSVERSLTSMVAGWEGELENKPFYMNTVSGRSKAPSIILNVINRGCLAMKLHLQSFSYRTVRPNLIRLESYAVM